MAFSTVPSDRIPFTSSSTVGSAEAARLRTPIAICTTLKRPGNTRAPGKASADQYPSSVIRCPFFLENGRFADAYHTLDLSMLRITGRVTGSISHLNDTIYPDFSPSIAGTVTQGTDGKQYFLSAGEAALTGGPGFFKDVSKVIVRCKYKATVDSQGDILLIACVNCVAILVGMPTTKA